jgi:hypothetical protein
MSTNSSSEPLSSFWPLAGKLQLSQQPLQLAPSRPVDLLHAPRTGYTVIIYFCLSPGWTENMQRYTSTCCYIRYTSRVKLVCTGSWHALPRNAVRYPTLLLAAVAVAIMASPACALPSQGQASPAARGPVVKRLHNHRPAL